MPGTIEHLHLLPSYKKYDFACGKFELYSPHFVNPPLLVYSKTGLLHVMKNVQQPLAINFMPWQSAQRRPDILSDT